MTSLLIPPAQRDALARWLDHKRALDVAAAHTITAYSRDVTGFLGLLAEHGGCGEGLPAVANLPQADLRSWMAFDRGSGVSSGSLARALSAVKSFVARVAAVAYTHLDVYKRQPQNIL